MSKRVRTSLIVFLTIFLVLCGITVIVVKIPYWKSQQTYGSASSSFTEHLDPESLAAVEVGAKYHSLNEWASGEAAPIKVDFKALKEINEDVIGWIYREDTVIDYPVLHGETNDTYLHTLFNKEYNPSGSIFQDSNNLKGFIDNNNILYGHHMADRSMFASLDEWQHQEYFDKHPVMWLLTPERDYRVELFSAYTISAYDETYTICRGFGGEEKGPELEEYLKKMKGRSAVECDVEFDPEGLYLVLSTCAYSFEDARSVVHGKMVPVNSAGGKRLTNPTPAAPAPTTP